MKVIGSGAEATVYEDFLDGEHVVVKERAPKTYRHPFLDKELRVSRTRREAKILGKLPVPGPRLIETDRESRITMEFIDGPPLKHLLDVDVSFARQVGESVGKLHAAHLVHGDLTTSNMLVRDETVHLIDFGLSFSSHDVEDKAVDVHVFKQALESKHYKVFDSAYQEFLQGYESVPGSHDVLERLRVVERRGKNKSKGS